MELKTQALDRVLGALSPTLAGEIDRVMHETREALEQEFQKRLETALCDAEAAAAISADAQVKLAVAEASENVRKQVSQELEQQFSEKLDGIRAELQSEAAADRTRLQQELEQRSKEKMEAVTAELQSE